MSLAASDAKQDINYAVEARTDLVVDRVLEALLEPMIQRAVHARTIATTKVPANPAKRGSHKGHTSKRKNLVRTKTH